jgi:dimethylargininase
VRIAITREVSAAITACELTHLDREPIDVDLAREQHRRYGESLAALGCEIRCLPVEPDLPDAVFVEDIAIVLDELAIVTRPGSESRRAERPSVAEGLARYRRSERIEAPGTLDGGDVLRSGRTIFVGRSSRTNDAGIEQLRALSEPLGYTVKPVSVTGCLHLKSAVTAVADDTVLINRDWIDAAAFAQFDCIDVDPSEQHAANALWVGGTVVYPSTYRGTRKRLEGRGIVVDAVDVSELTKAEGGVTCCSLIFETRERDRP